MRNIPVPIRVNTGMIFMSASFINPRAVDSRIALLVFPYVAIQFLNGFYLPMLSQSAMWYWAYDVSANALLPIYIYWQLRKINVLPKAYGFKNPHYLYDSTEMAGQALILFMLSGFVYFVSYKLLWKLYPPSIAFTYVAVMPSDAMLRLLTDTYFSVTAGLVESVVYLGIAKLIVEQHIKGRTGDLVFVIASTLIFTAVHWEQGMLPMLTAGCMQLIFSLAYLRIKYLPPFIAAHFAIDFVIFF